MTSGIGREIKLEHMKWPECFIRGPARTPEACPHDNAHYVIGAPPTHLGDIGGLPSTEGVFFDRLRPGKLCIC